MGRQVYEFASL